MGRTEETQPQDSKNTLKNNKKATCSLAGSSLQDSAPLPTSEVPSPSAGGQAVASGMRGVQTLSVTGTAGFILVIGRLAGVALGMFAGCCIADKNVRMKQKVYFTLSAGKTVQFERTE